MWCFFAEAVRTGCRPINTHGAMSFHAVSCLSSSHRSFQVSTSLFLVVTGCIPGVHWVKYIPLWNARPVPSSVKKRRLYVSALSSPYNLYPPRPQGMANTLRGTGQLECSQIWSFLLIHSQFDDLSAISPTFLMALFRFFPLTPSLPNVVSNDEATNPLQPTSIGKHFVLHPFLSH